MVIGRVLYPPPINKDDPQLLTSPSPLPYYKAMIEVTGRILDGYHTKVVQPQHKVYRPLLLHRYLEMYNVTDS